MKKRKIIAVLIIFIFIEITAFIYIEFLHKAGIKHYLSERTKELVIKQKAVQNTYSLMVKNIFDQSINRPEIVKIFSQAQFADSLRKVALRDTLQQILTPIYSYLKSNNVKQLHFHLPNNESFLRMHRPKKYGDNLSDVRYSVRMTNQNKKSYHGFEEGRVYNGFRNVFPLFYDSLHIGSVETSFSFEAIEAQLRQHEDVVYGFMIKKEIVGEKVFASEKSNYTLSTISDNYMYEAKYMHYENDTLNQIKEIDKSIRIEVSDKLARNENFTVFKKIGSSYYLISFVLVKNIEGMPVAYIFSYKKDITIGKYQSNNILSHSIAAFLIIIITFFIVLTLLKDNRVKEIDSDYKDILDANSDVVFMINILGKQLYFNKQVETLLGYDRTEIIGKRFINFVPTTEISKYLGKLKELFLTKEILAFETLSLHRDGSLIPVEITGKIIKYNGKTVGVGSIRDIRDRKKTEEKIVEQNEEYAAINEELRQNLEELTVSNEQIELQYRYIEESRERLKKAQEVGKIGSWEWNIENDEIVWSDMTFKIFGIKQTGNTITTEQYFDKIYPDDKEYLIENLDKAIKKKQKVLKTEYRILRGNQIVWINENSEIITDKEGKLIKMIGVLQDISEQKKAEQKIRQLSTVVEQSPSAIIITDTTGAIEYVNSSFTESTGYTFEEAKGQNPRILKAEGTKPEIYISLWETLLSGETWSGEFLNINKNGEEYWEQAIISSIKNNKNEITNYLAIKYDITARKATEKELEKAKLDAESANRLKSEFLANMSHEIRTPMNSIIGFSSILQRQLKDDKLRSFANRIAKSGNNLIDLINDILDLSKIEAGQLEIQKEAANPYDIFNEIPFIFSELSKEKQVDVNIIIDQNLPKSLKIDALRIRQILLNLVGNALKFTEKGSISVIITLSKIKRTSKTIELGIEVKDTGIGIPKKELEAIFYSFKQVEGQSTKKYGGTGLGLAISKRLIELMEGTITVKSTVNIGSSFIITFKNIEILSFEQNKTIEDENVEINFRNSKILHVEDIEYNRELISLFLEDKNIELNEAVTGIEALEILKTNIPDLILMDIQIPKLSGYETAKIIRENEKLSSIPIIAITANATKEDIERYSHVFDEYLTKPVNEKLLFKVIAKYLDHQKEKRENKSTEEIENCLSMIHQQKEGANKYSDKLKELIKNQLEPLCDELTEVLSVDNLEIFAIKNNEVGEKYQVPALVKFSKKLEASITNFDLNKIKETLKIFKQIVAAINN